MLLNCRWQSKHTNLTGSACGHWSVVVSSSAASVAPSPAVSEGSVVVCVPVVERPAKKPKQDEKVNKRARAVEERCARVCTEELEPASGVALMAGVALVEDKTAG